MIFLGIVLLVLKYLFDLVYNPNYLNTFTGENTFTTTFNLDVETRNLGFVKDVDSYRNGFVIIETNPLRIGHTITNKRININQFDLKSWVKYFNRL
jgi:hypothetical protein